MQSKGNKDNRGDILVFRAFLFPLCSNSCCWITSFARLVPSHNGESLTMVRTKSLLVPRTPFGSQDVALIDARQCQQFLFQIKTFILLVFFFWMYILHNCTSEEWDGRFRKLVTRTGETEGDTKLLHFDAALTLCIWGLCIFTLCIWEVNLRRKKIEIACDAAMVNSTRNFSGHPFEPVGRRCFCIGFR